MEENKKDNIQIGTQTNNNGEQGAEFIESVAAGAAEGKKMTKGEKRAAKKMAKALLKKGIIDKETYDNILAKLRTM